MMYHVRLFVLNHSSEFDPMDPDDLISLGEHDDTLEQHLNWEAEEGPAGDRIVDRRVSSGRAQAPGSHRDPARNC